MNPSPPCPLSVLIPTLNEERNLPDCLASVAFASERIVYDSYSSDATEAIAKQHQAGFIQRRFDNFSAHKNWALDHINFAHPWVLILDADERVSPALAEQIQQLLSQADGPPYDGYYLARRIHWQGRWLAHGGRYPDYQLRLFRHRKGRYEQRLVHEHLQLDGRVGKLKQALEHKDDKGIERYIDRHNHYSTLEAIEILREQQHSTEASALPVADKSQGPQTRRRMKRFAYRHLPARPLWVFLYMYILKLGFLDGRPGLDSAVLRAIYEYQIDLKRRELNDPQSPLSQRLGHIQQTNSTQNTSEAQ